LKAKDYQLYTARDFALDEDFQEWILQPDIKNTHLWESWLRANPEKQRTIDEATHLVRSIRFREYKITDHEKAQLWDSIWENRGEEQEVIESIVPIRKRWTSTWKYAAAILLGLLLTGIWLAEKQFRFQAVTYSTQTSLGEVKKLWLPDSSEVILNANSSIVYAEKNAATREIWLEGEAWFHVKHTPDNRQFIVHANDKLAVEVLGTQFNVNSFGDNVAVVLEQGQVKLDITETDGRNKTQIYLQPGEIVNYNKLDGNYNKRKTIATTYTSWASRRISMDNYTLADAGAFMEQVFGKRLVGSDSVLLHSYKVSGSMPIIYHPDTMLLQFEKVFRVKFQQKGNEFSIKKQFK
jgi:transmembrane sensor